MLYVKNNPIIYYVYNALVKSNKISKIIVATSLDKSDNKLVHYLKKNNIKFYRGSLNNVSKRLYNCAIKNKSNFFIRVSGDSPLIDYKLIDKAINIHRKYKSLDIITNVFPRTFPKGMSVEIIRAKIIKENLKLMTPFDKEHVTPFFYRNYNKFKIYNFKSRKKFSKNLVIDTLSDLKRLKIKISK